MSSLFRPAAPAASASADHKIRVAVLGASGSVGSQTLDVCRANRDKIEVVALSVYDSRETLIRLVHEFHPRYANVTNALHKGDASLENLGLTHAVDLSFGAKALEDLVDADDIDVVVCAIVGASGMRVGARALKAGKTLGYANKESIVVAGDILMPLVRPGKLIPIDSEHSAIFQCLVGEDTSLLDSIWLTCSGGPFYGMSRKELATKTAADALRHPTWHMGPKITIDSATLMNKGLEVLEATRLFDCSIDQVKVLIHPESKIHSMVQFKDGSVKAQLGPSDMRLPIQYALSYPTRWDTPSPQLPDWREVASLHFGSPDLEAFGCLRLAIEAGRVGKSLPCVLNAANEVVNLAFREGRCGFLDIERVVEQTLDASEAEVVESLAQLEEIDARARSIASSLLNAYE